MFPWLGSILTSFFSSGFGGKMLVTWTSLAPDFGGVQTDTISVATSILGIMVVVVAVGILIAVFLRH